MACRLLFLSRAGGSGIDADEITLNSVSDSQATIEREVEVWMEVHETQSFQYQYQIVISIPWSQKHRRTVTHIQAGIYIQIIVTDEFGRIDGKSSLHFPYLMYFASSKFFSEFSEECLVSFLFTRQILFDFVCVILSAKAVIFRLQRFSTWRAPSSFLFLLSVVPLPSNKW